jgi:hypothetical protein
VNIRNGSDLKYMQPDTTMAAAAVDPNEGIVEVDNERTSYGGEERMVSRGLCDIKKRGCHSPVTRNIASRLRHSPPHPRRPHTGMDPATNNKIRPRGERPSLT